MKKQDYIVNQNFDIESLNYNNISELISGINYAASLKKLCYFVFDYFKHNYLYIKTYNEFFTEIPEIIKEPYLFFNNKIHPDDLFLVHQIHHKTFNYVFSLDKKERNDLQLHYNCRFQNKFDKYIMTDISLKVIKTDSKGNI